ncbi:MAG: AAA family ATPase [Candidatus Nanopelagicales bacterium]
MSVFDSLVGQDHVIEVLQAAAADASVEPAGPAMTHAWLFIGPPGSGRSNAAIAFGAALVCPNGGCGLCEDCRAVRVGNHPDVEVVRPEGLSYKTEEARALVGRADLAPARARWHVIVMEDADRLTESANNVLLKSIEEPASRTVWLLCAPSVEDLLPTVRSRCQVIGLRTPSTAAVAAFLRAAGSRCGNRRLRRAGVDGPHRPGQGAGHHRERAQPSPRRAGDDARPVRPGQLHGGGGQHRRGRQGRRRGAAGAARGRRARGDDAGARCGG